MGKQGSGPVSGEMDPTLKDAHLKHANETMARMEQEERDMADPERAELLQCRYDLAKSEAILKKCQSLLRRLAAGEAVGDEVRIYFERNR